MYRAIGSFLIERMMRMEKEIRDRLLIYFGVKNHKELTEFIDENPSNHKVLILEEMLAEWGVKIEEGLFQEFI